MTKTENLAAKHEAAKQKQPTKIVEIKQKAKA